MDPLNSVGRSLHPIRSSIYPIRSSIYPSEEVGRASRASRTGENGSLLKMLKRWETPQRKVPETSENHVKRGSCTGARVPSSDDPTRSLGLSFWKTYIQVAVKNFSGGLFTINSKKDTNHTLKLRFLLPNTLRFSKLFTRWNPRNKKNTTEIKKLKKSSSKVCAQWKNELKFPKARYNRKFEVSK